MLLSKRPKKDALAPALTSNPVSRSTHPENEAEPPLETPLSSSSTGAAGKVTRLDDPSTLPVSIAFATLVSADSTALETVTPPLAEASRLRAREALASSSRKTLAVAAPPSALRPMLTTGVRWASTLPVAFTPALAES